jgi:hypothetical protein
VLAGGYTVSGGTVNQSESERVQSDANFLPEWERRTPLDAAIRGEATALAGWLRDRGAKTAAELPVS